MESVYISGRFVNKDTQEPVDGPIELIPSRLWVTGEDGLDYAVLAPSTITRAGRFKVEVTTCKQREGDFGWHYQIKCPMGIWTIKPNGEDGEVLDLKDMLPTRYT